MVDDCNMKSLIVCVITAAILCNIKLLVTAQKERVYCVSPPYQNVTGTEITGCSNHTKWMSILLNATSYFTSDTKLYFLPGTYKLDRHLQINGVKNLLIIGDKENFTILCQTNTSGVSLSVSNSLFVELQNIKFKNCKMNIQHVNYTTGSNLLSTSVSVALFLYNVTALKITNVSFKNCNCHAIVGINMLGSLQNVSIFSTYKRVVHRDENISSVGGFVLVYSDNVIQNHAYKTMQVLIDSCAIFNIINTGSSNKSKVSNELNTSVIGIGFYQQKYFIKVTLFNITIKNVNVIKGPIVLIKYHSCMNSVWILTSSFSNIVSKQQPIISIVAKTNNTDINKSPAVFSLIHSKIILNKALSILHVLQPTTQLNITVHHAEFAHNKAGVDFWKIKLLKPGVAVVNSNFISNTGFTLWLYSVDIVKFIGNNKFLNNSVRALDNAIIRGNGTILTFKGYSEFSNNTANIIISLVEKYIALYENTTISFLQNKACVYTKSKQNQTKSLIKFKKKATLYKCLFQFFSKSGNLDKDFMNNNNTVMYFNVTFSGNRNYNSTIFGTQLNSCYWVKPSAFKILTPGYVYTRVLHFNVTHETITWRQGVTFCSCEDTGHVDCITDQFGPIYPGQNIPISLRQLKLSSTTKDVPLIERNFSPVTKINDRPKCALVPLYGANLVQVISEHCTSLLYTVSNDHNYTSCYVHLSDTSSPNIWYTYSVYYFIDFKKGCPLGFENHNGVCECSKQLEAALPGLTCDIKTQSITSPGRSWIGLSSSKQNILYVTRCHTFCSKQPTTIQLEFPDAQCMNSRTGIMCGQCPPGLDATFGSFGCQKCSNYWLLLTPAFMLAGISLVLCLFVLNLTVVDGKLNGFILYTNLVAGNSYNVYPSKGNIFFVLLSMFNLDLGIETCFYHGMTEYSKTWLQFAFPTYLLFIVGVLTIASRYSSLVEKLTRRRVIPVIATIFLLTYNKLLLTTAKVLCSYRTVHSLHDNENSIIWTWDTGVPILSMEFLSLLIVCMLVFFILILPFNFFLLFTKFSYRLKFVAEYLKPYLDAYQAPFKSHCCYYFGIELLLRPIAFAVGNRILDPHKTLAVVTLLSVILLLYICIIKPFKNKVNTFLYVSYLFNTTCLILIVIYFNTKLSSMSYEISYNILHLIAFIQFGCTVFYYLYINHLHKIKRLENCFKRTNIYLQQFWNRFKEHKRNAPPNLLPLEHYEQLQEELLIIDPSP